MQNDFISFQSSLIPLVISGEKTLTYRLDKRYVAFKAGDHVNLINSDTRELFGEAEILENSQVLFKDLPLDQNGQEVFSSKENQRNIFKKHYKRDISDNEVVVVLQFKLTKSLNKN